MFVRRVLAAVIAIGTAGPAWAQGPPRTPDDSEMGRPKAAVPAKADPAALAAFDAAYRKSQGVARSVFERYLPILGTGAILDYLESQFAPCHSQAHDLGRALYAARQDVGGALRECGTRCTSACMHGVVGEAFGDATPVAIAKSMNGFCASGAMAEIHKPGNCAHGIGHALMFTTADDLDTSLNACLYFDAPGMRYYCATGVFMEYMPRRKPGTRAQLHEPCSSHPGFAAACYRYRAPLMLAELNGDRESFRRECESLAGPARLGCFHGLGSTLTEPLFRDPTALARACDRGPQDERVLCIEGAIEKLADFDQATADAACAALQGPSRDVCRAAAEQKMYRLEKASLPLYQDPRLVETRKPLTGVAR